METSTASKYVLTTQPALPSTCAGCNRSANGYIQFVDLQLSLDWYGAVVICEDCAKEMVALVNYAPVAVVEELEQKLELLKAEIAAKDVTLNEYANVFNGLSRFRPDLVSDLPADEGELEDSGTESDSGGEPESEPVEDESGPSESASEWGPEDISESPDESRFV